MTNQEKSVLAFDLPDGETLQSQLNFDPDNQEMLLSCSRNRVILYHWVGKYPVPIKTVLCTCHQTPSKLPLIVLGLTCCLLDE